MAKKTHQNRIDVKQLSTSFSLTAKMDAKKKTDGTFGKQNLDKKKEERRNERT